MKVVLMAGGKGTRISELFPNIPKPLIPIEGVPVLEREIISLRDQGFKDIILTIGYMADKIKNYFGDGSKWGVNISYFVEEKPLGNAGALFFLNIEDDFLLLNADAIFDVDFKRMVKYHKEKGGLVTLFTHPNSHPYDSGLIISKENGVVERWLTKEDTRPDIYKNRVNAGLHVISSKALKRSGINREEIGKEVNGKIKKVDLDRQILKPLCSTGKMFCYDSPEYVKDMGTPERYLSVCDDYKKGVVQAKNLKNKQKAIFLDRDGTINKYVGFLRKQEELELLSDAAEAIKQINKSDAVSTSSIDELYEKGIKAGALGGKLLGAGGGGFLVFYVQPEKQKMVKEAMKDLMHIPFRFEDGGTRVIHYSPEEYEEVK